MENPLRVLVVDDSAAYRAVVSNALADIPGVEVVGVAANGRIALDKIETLRPDVLTLDVAMPEMGGLELLGRLRSSGSDVGAIMISAVTAEGAHATIEALELGAFDFVVKPDGGSPQTNAERLRQQLRLKIEAFARSRAVRAILHGPAGKPPARLAGTAHDHQTPPQKHGAAWEGKGRALGTAPNSGQPEVVAMGISTGGPPALTFLLPQLPADLPVAVLIVQHMPPMFTRSLAEDLDRRCALHVCEASDGQAVAAGSILIAPGGKQMRVERLGAGPVIRITDDPPENSCRPSVDYLFRSVAETYGPRAVGVIMTGMGSDGAQGCRLMHQRGAIILAQDQASCVVFGMPREPVEQRIAAAIPLEAMASELVRLVRKGAAVCK
jgi:two-component system chemotaxis response regulator CheB